jgi:hypothetical protein
LGDSALKLTANGDAQVTVFTAFEIPPDLDREEFMIGFERGFRKNRNLVFTNPIVLGEINGKLSYLKGRKRDTLELVFVHLDWVYVFVFQASGKATNEDLVIQNLIRSIRLIEQKNSVQ